ncbi:hypothetical protein PR048_001865 [Dryococelus australis]|uniref:Uncharacterized protein n=1 Tax=Dryococelus australis TaxID=614101 RepID=A0ABQ9IIN3_9NEOP|nr:hypothetical protein PR048_001865 [Dryococelus australis]
MWIVYRLVSGTQNTKSVPKDIVFEGVPQKYQVTCVMKLMDVLMPNDSQIEVSIENSYKIRIMRELPHMDNSLEFVMLELEQRHILEYCFQCLNCLMNFFLKYETLESSKYCISVQEKTQPHSVVQAVNIVTCSWENIQTTDN